MRAAFRWWDKSTSTAVGETVLTRLGKTMTYAGYLFGHADGRDVDPFEGRDGLRELIDQHGLMPWLEDVRDKLRTLFDTRESWADLAEHYTLSRALEAGCKRYGLTVGRSPNFAVGWTVTPLPQ